MAQKGSDRGATVEFARSAKVISTLHGEKGVGLAMLEERHSRLLRKSQVASTLVELILAYTPSPGQLIQVGLAVYLLPVLVVVLAVGTIGILVVAASRVFCGGLWREICVLRERVGQEIFRS
jgi:hypothetical protein